MRNVSYSFRDCQHLAQCLAHREHAITLADRWVGLWQISPGWLTTPSLVETANCLTKSVFLFSLAHSQASFPICLAGRCGHVTEVSPKGCEQSAVCQGFGRPSSRAALSFLQPGWRQGPRGWRRPKMGKLGPCTTAWRRAVHPPGRPTPTGLFMHEK